MTDMMMMMIKSHKRINFNPIAEIGNSFILRRISNRIIETLVPYVPHVSFRALCTSLLQTSLGKAA